MIALALVCGTVADGAYLMEEVEHLGRRGAFKLEAAQQVGLRLVSGDQKANAGGGLTRQLLAELAQLDQTGRGVVRKIPLGQGAQAVELAFIGAQKKKVVRGRLGRHVQLRSLVCGAAIDHSRATARRIKGSTRSSGSGKTMVELLSPAMAVRVSR